MIPKRTFTESSFFRQISVYTQERALPCFKTVIIILPPAKITATAAATENSREESPHGLKSSHKDTKSIARQKVTHGVKAEEIARHIAKRVLERGQ